MISSTLYSIPSYNCGSLQAGKLSRGFTLIELIVVVAIVAALIALILPVYGKARQASQALVCASNLRQIGVAMQSYANRHHSALPYAMWVTLFDQKALTWDDLINQDLGGNLNWDEMTAFQSPRAVPVVVCPTDTRDSTYSFRYRSYSIPRCLNSQYPIRGLEFNGLAGDATFNAPPVPPTDQVRRISLKLNEIRRPSETLMIVEHPGGGNLLGSNAGVYVDVPSLQWEFLSAKPGTTTPHGTVWNYLFVDGHVQAMTAQETVTPSKTGTRNLNGASGMWTRDPYD